ncbi:MAG: hypothetical protein WD825_13465 [Gemmatimonadaceae bacterium]
MDPAPEDIGGFEVICWTILDDRHEASGRAAHSVRGGRMSPPSGLAICKDDRGGAFYLFQCDDDWEPMSDSWHQTLDDAKNQAELEFTGSSDTWETPE